MTDKATNVNFIGGKIHIKSDRYTLYTLCGRYVWSTIRETLLPATCKKCIKAQTKEVS